MIRSVLIANRGEIACRIIRTARRLGIRTVAVYSEVDAGALHVTMADAAVPIGPAPARDSYLNAARIVEAALSSGAEAVHPGYGFLSENAGFAEAVAAAGLVWVGPSPAAIRAMGLKDAAKALMARAGVPTTPGYLGAEQDPARLAAEADALGYPILIKAVAGGGGKGMRRVEAAADFAAALEACRREAQAAFADPRVMLETCIPKPRHLEVQVFGDTHGNIVHLFERDCSLQRRHQKVIEEAPAPGLTQDARAALCEAAVRAARAVDYVGAGTVEFIADASEGLRADRMWFMEMNTRLQVEHPVTEEITGQDLVEWQFRVASGEPLPMRQEDLAIGGWAMEARLYAEDPRRGFLPSTGTVAYLRLPADIRVETGIREGDAVSAFYDPMLAKLVVSDTTRTGAARRLAGACASTAVWPVRTNAALLTQLLESDAFTSGDVDTGLIERHASRLMPDGPPDPAVLAAGAAALVADAQPGILAGLAGFRLNRAPETRVRVQIEGVAHEAKAAADISIRVTRLGDGVLVDAKGDSFHVRADRSDAPPAAATSDGSILSPMPGRVTVLQVTEGAEVTAGQLLAVVEAMKMEHGIVAPFAGTVRAVSAKLDAQVQEGSVLMRIEAAA